MNTLQLEKFEGVAKFLSVLFKIFFILCLVGAGLAVIGSIACLFFPTSLLNQAIDAINSIDTSVKVGGFSVYVSSLNLTVGAVKTVSICLTLVVGVAAAIGSFLFLQLRKILSNVVEKQPFAQGSIVAMKRLSIGLVVYSVFSSVGSLMTNKLMLEYIFKNVADVSSDLIQRVDFNIDFVFILVGLLVYLLAKIFEYGGSLQNEVDEML
ncbi:hypothetical protein M2140_001866 [Clostridiales Family XIII bacterium PM5-7]